MIGRLAWRGLTDRPWRSLFLLAGFGLGVGVMITLLAIGEAMVAQASDEKLVGGGSLTVLPEGMDLEVMKTGGVGGMFLSIPNARFVHRQLLASPRLKPGVTAVAPQTDGVLLYVRTADGREHPVRAIGELPSASAAVGAAPTIVAGAWSDDEQDRRWIAPTDAELRLEIDRLHHPPASVSAEDRKSWAEWHYFNLLSPDRKRWVFVTLLVGGDIPAGEWGGQVLITVQEEGKPARRFVRPVLPAGIGFDTTRADLALDGDTVRVLPDGRYRVVAHGREEGGRAEARVELELTPSQGAWFPGASIGGEGVESGYAVAALRGDVSGTVCIAGQCDRYERVQGYHDHNWGVWREVEWEWGSARLGRSALLYGRVKQGGEEGAEAPLFLYLVDSLGFRALFRPRVIVYDDARTITVGGKAVRVPARAVMTDVRGDDSIRVELEIEDATGTDIRSGERRASSRTKPYFIQMKGKARMSGRIGGVVIRGEGTGFFETYRGAP